MDLKSQARSEETRRKILAAALLTFREQGFAPSTMREIAAEAGVAVGAAYYYFSSKDAIVLEFYQQAQEEMRPELEGILDRSRSFEARLRGILEYKLHYFAPNRTLLAALTAHIDPAQPLSPFSRETAPIREQELRFFVRAVEESKIKLPPSILPFLPRLLWLYEMGLLLFWVYDRSARQARTAVLLDRTVKMLVMGVRLAGLPVLRPLHRLAGELLESVFGKS